MNRKLAALAIFIAGGIAKLPLEQRLSDDLHAKALLEEPVGIDMRENLGQMGFAASLGGLRSLVASITYLQAYSAFEDVDWGKVDSLMTITTRLQPREAIYWDDAAWHQAWNGHHLDPYVIDWKALLPSIHLHCVAHIRRAKGWSEQASKISCGSAGPQAYSNLDSDLVRRCK